MAKKDKGPKEAYTKNDVVRDDTVHSFKHESTPFLQSQRSALIGSIDACEAEIDKLLKLIDDLKARRSDANAMLQGVEALIASRG